MWTSEAGGLIGFDVKRILRDWPHTLAIVLVLSIGIGPATVGLSVREDVLIRPLGYDRPDRLGVIRMDVGDLLDHPGVAQTELVELQETAGPFQAVEAAYSYAQTVPLGSEMMSVARGGVSAGLLRTLGVTPILGRLFTEEDDGRNVMILGYSLWQTQFSGDTAIIGRAIPLSQQPTVVVGVLPAGFRLHLGLGSAGPSQIDVWTLTRPVRTNPRVTGWSRGWKTVVRLNDGLSFRQANEMLQAFSQHQAESYPAIYAGSTPRFTVSPLLADLVRPIRPALNLVLAGVLILLITAVTNAATLVALRTRSREGEWAVRSALGASRRRLVVGLMLDVSILGVGGIALGWLLAHWEILGVRGVIPHAVPRWETISFGLGPATRVAAVTLTGLLAVGTAASWKGGRGTPWNAMASVARTVTGARRGAQTVLVGLQVVMSVVLLFGAAQLTRSARNLAETDLGFSPEGVLAFEVGLEFPGFEAGDRPWENQRYHGILRRLEAVPGVRGVSAVSSQPLADRGTVNTFATPSSGPSRASEDPTASFFAVLPGYFETVGIAFLQGRDFTMEETVEGRPAAIVDEGLARRFFPGSSALGELIRVHVAGGSQHPQLPDARIVGVVRHARVVDPTGEARPQIYLPFGFWRSAPLQFVVRADGDPRALLPTARGIVEEVGTSRPISRVHLLSENLADHTGALRSITLLVLVLAATASALCVVGVFSVASFVVMRERRAIAIKGAVGASRASLLIEQIRGVSVALCVAVTAGVVVAWMGAGLADALLYGVESRDPLSLGGAAFVGMAMGFVGTYIPARRASSVDPASVLKSD